MTETTWLFVLRTDHIPGVAANIAAAFSRRGIQIDGICAEGDILAHGRPGAVVSVTFTAFPQRMEIIRRKLERLDVVRDLRVWDCGVSPDLRRAAAALAEGRQRALAALMANHPPVKETIARD